MLVFCTAVGDVLTELPAKLDSPLGAWAFRPRSPCSSLSYYLTVDQSAGDLSTILISLFSLLISPVTMPKLVGSETRLCMQLCQITY